jgi:hypothetical protein
MIAACRLSSIKAITMPANFSSPSTAAEAVPVADYREWPFQDFLKRTKVGDDVRYNLEFKLPSVSEHFHLPINPAAWASITKLLRIPRYIKYR